MFKSRMNLLNCKSTNCSACTDTISANPRRRKLHAASPPFIPNQNVRSTRHTPCSNFLHLASTCAWCQKLGVRLFTLQTDNGETKTLCSEVCFNQYRRASFKRNRVRARDDTIRHSRSSLQGSETDNDPQASPIASAFKNKVEKRADVDTSLTIALAV